MELGLLGGFFLLGEPLGEEVLSLVGVLFTFCVVELL